MITKETYYDLSGIQDWRVSIWNWLQIMHNYNNNNNNKQQYHQNETTCEKKV
jgi:hypothetical protein